jgi:hypothetical protein
MHFNAMQNQCHKEKLVIFTFTCAKLVVNTICRIFVTVTVKKLLNKTLFLLLFTAAGRLGQLF